MRDLAAVVIWQVRCSGLGAGGVATWGVWATQHEHSLYTTYVAGPTSWQNWMSVNGQYFDHHRATIVPSDKASKDGVHKKLTPCFTIGSVAQHGQW